MTVAQKIGRPPLAIGPIALDGAVALAPMSGVTDAGFRRVAAGFGASLVVSEMVASDELVAGSAEAVLRAEGEGIAPHVVQLAGCSPRWMAEGARVAEASGAAIVDINMGCPAKRVVGGWAGSALMRDLDQAEAIIAAVVGAVKVPVTLKMRLGWDESSLNAPELARRAAARGVAAVTVHGRTRRQFYKGRADWRAVAAVRAAIDLPLIVNGDIASAADARAALAASGADAVMIGRAALGRPWLPGQVARALAEGGEPSPPTLAARRDGAVAHYLSLVCAYGRETGLRHARKHLAATVESLSEEGLAVPDHVRRDIVTSEDPDHVVALLERAFASPPRLERAA